MDRAGRRPFLLLCLLCIVLSTAAQQCALRLYFTSASQANHVVFTGLTAEEKATNDNSTLGSILACDCTDSEGLTPVYWLGNNGMLLPEDDRNEELVDYRVANNQPGTAVYLRINRAGFSCAEAGIYICVIGTNNRSILVTPIGQECGPANVTTTTSPPGPVSIRTNLTLQCSADDPTESGLMYEWLMNGTQISGEFSPTLMLRVEGPDDGGTYTCRVSNRAGQGEASVTVEVIGPPVLECPVDSPIAVTPDVFVIVDMSIGCDLCFEAGLTINILDIICNPSAVEMIRTPVDCVMTTPNGTDVTAVNDPTLNFLVTSFGGSVTASIAEANNPESFPGGMEVLGTWTCQCNNSDGRAIATSTLAPCPCVRTCQNNGTLDTDSCTCNCVPEFTGEMCETCTKVCDNGGTLDEETCECICSTEFTGEMCESFIDIGRYVAVGSHDVVRIPVDFNVTLDCLPYANNTYGLEANLSTIRWFRIATKSSEVVGTETEITKNGSRLILSGNKERLTIVSVTTATRAERGTEAAYRCEVCQNRSPELQNCSSSSIEVNAFSPPVLECPVDSPITVTPDVFVTVEMSIGCDLCFEVGLTINILDIICNPNQGGTMVRSPVDCVMTTPNGTDVTTVNDPTFNFLVTSFGGSVTASISEANNPESFPGGIEVLGTWTCQCNNSDGRAIATNTLAPCRTDCAPKNCMNGGTQDPSTCDCICPPEYTGELCESCVPKNCMNGGTQDPSACDCVCPPEYTGELCGSEKCELVCQNGGTLEKSSCSCSCLPKYTGKECETFTGIENYLAVGSLDAVIFPAHARARVTLDCLPYANNTYGLEANLSTIRWFRIATKSSEVVGTETEITKNGSRLILSGNKERLTIVAVTIATRAERGTEAAYRCEVCQNRSPELQNCSSSSIEFNVFSPPVLECNVQSPITVTPDVFVVEEMYMGCDLCFEAGLTINILDIICIPDLGGMIRTPVDCVMTTPNGTDVTAVKDPTFSFLVTSFGGSVTASISEARNPETFPGGIEVLGTWTCQCNNSDGRAIATSTLAPCPCVRTCQNNGTLDTDSCTCNCVPEFTGEMCENCVTKNCMNGGTQDPSTCDCVCPPEYTGELCENLSDDLCPPNCSKSVCKGKTNRVCVIPNADSCGNPCGAVTSCKACYFSKNDRPLPDGCKTKLRKCPENNEANLQKCLSKWGQCLKTKLKRLYGKTKGSLKKNRNFKCFTPCSEQ